MTKKNLFEEAHKMTKEIIEENEEMNIDYQAQFGLCVTYLLETKDGKQITIKIKGDATDEEKAQINEVAKAFADYYCDDVCTVVFQIWRRNGFNRAYIEYSERSAYQNKKRSFYDFDEGYLKDCYVRYRKDA